MKALSLLQPWASLVEYEAKQWETRGYRTHYRGRIAIHASQRYTGALRALAKSRPFGTALNSPRELPTGAIIAVADITDCIPSEKWIAQHCTADGQALKEHQREFKFGDYSPGRFAWKLENVHRLSEPVECKGALSLWEVPADIAAEVERRIL